MTDRKQEFRNPISADPDHIPDQKFDFIKSLMKNVIIFCLIILSTGCASRDHLKFQGIPINGDLKSFTEELKKMGFAESLDEEGDQVKFTGEYLGKDCTLYLFATLKSQTPYMMRVDLSEEPSDSLRHNYERLKKHCASILGPGASKYQQFNNSPRFLFNEPRMVREPKNGDYTRYLSRRGSVYLEVKFNYLSITYIDKRNSELSVEEGGKVINPENGKEF